MNNLVRVYKTIRQVGLRPVLQVALYRFGLITGHYRRSTPPIPYTGKGNELTWIKPVKKLDESDLPGFFQGEQTKYEESPERLKLPFQGKCEIFGRQVVDIFQTFPDINRHWTDYELGRVKLPEKDIKFVWEPARLGWIYSLARARVRNLLPDSGVKGWSLLKEFFHRNPVNCGPNWMNGQEVALRIIALVFFHEVFYDDDLPADWEQILAAAVVDHARRIPPTMVYARSQQNNHLLVEAAGLYTAGVFLPDFPESTRWKKVGWETFHQALNDQVADDGLYLQYSTNYHRLMLQIAIWMKAISTRAGDEFPEQSQQKLATATAWLAGLMFAETGRVPNYGHNDGAYILPLTGNRYDDFRPVVHTARHCFNLASPDEKKDEMTLWFEWLAGKSFDGGRSAKSNPAIQSYKKLSDGQTSIILFGPDISRRPGQADLLHVDLWHNGLPVLLDPGTYRYNDEPPWDNALTRTIVHNSVSINGEDQMTRAGRFLWLDWPVIKWGKEKHGGNSLEASHNGYHRFGLIHEREVVMINEHVWRVFDRIIPENGKSPSPVDISINWLLPSLDWHIDETSLRFEDTFTSCKVVMTPISAGGAHLVYEYQVIKAGKMLYSSTGRGIPEEDIVNLGWYSPTYGYLEPAVSYRVLISGITNLEFLTEFNVC